MDKNIIPEVANAKLIKINKPNLSVKDSIIIMGADGTGKTTISKTIKERLPNLKHFERWLNLQIGRQQDIGCLALSKSDISAPMIDGKIKHAIPYPDFLQYFVWSIVDDISQELNLEPKFVEGLAAPKVYALLAKYLNEERQRGKSHANVAFLEDMKSKVKHLLHEMSGIYENVFYLDVPQDKLIDRIRKRNIKMGIKHSDIFDKQVELKDSAEIYMNVLHESFEILGAKPINADVPYGKMPNVAEEIIERSGMCMN